MSCLRRWFLDLSRPSIKHVRVVLFENGKEKDVSRYDDARIRILINAINSLWKVADDSPYWFETEYITRRYCFQKPISYLQVTCYVEDVKYSDMKKPMAISNRYRKKMFDKFHPIHPKLFSSLHWADRMEVKFVCNEDQL